MKKNTITKVLATSAVALSLAVLPASAQTSGTTTGTDGTGTTTTQTGNYNNDEGRNGYWGLLGLLGLFGLMGRRSKQDDVAAAYRDPSTSETTGSRRY